MEKKGFRERIAYVLLGISIFLNTIIAVIVMVPILKILGTNEDYILFGLPLLLPTIMVILVPTENIFETIIKSIYINNTRKLFKEEEDYLNPIVNDILILINQEKNLKLELKDFKFEIIKSKELEAFAYGKNTICISEGLLYNEDISEDELKAVLIHEFSHVLNKDTIFLMCMLVSNLFMKMFGMIGAAWNKGVKNRSGSKKNDSVILDLFILVLYLVFVKLLSETLLTILLRIYDRKVEYYCDEFVAELGYGEYLIQFFYRIMELEREYGISNSNNLLEMMYSTHPKTEDRIKKLEEYKKEEKKGISYT